jgi:hypothetical protein
MHAYAMMNRSMMPKLATELYNVCYDKSLLYIHSIFIFFLFKERNLQSHNHKILGNKRTFQRNLQRESF